MSESSGRGRQSKAAAAKHQKEKKRKKNATARAAKAKTKAAAKARDEYYASLPKISEDDLLRFQFAHFGDDTKPDNWFVTKEAALSFEDDDGLGYYADGVKRTLTDEQIAVFRRTELWQMKHEQEQRQQDERNATDAHDPELVRAASPISDVSSLEDELLAYATVKQLKSQSVEPKQRQPSHGSRSDSNSASRRGRPSQQNIPYDQRNKRRWEGYIHDEDPIEGSLTHRRVARELDDQQAEPVEMDY
ncbi:hypothetical protein AC578_2214 [Pseudocercospora eumusae]|uniref:Uncharacterized protein n=1 Tax=Pseudocercospora eumusae TaxID=321146 RepID=A0A139HB26_9PEZI|nr:hypothetical protein AC578_2214 [Pseudocercospora eumusae]KXS99568.1 hypothetical protein AC578_2214 [Pseudocercospora eumusae]